MVAAEMVSRSAASGRSAWVRATRRFPGQGSPRSSPSLVLTTGQNGDIPQFVAVLEAVRVPRVGRAAPAPDRTASAWTRPAARGRTVPTCGDASSDTRFPSPMTRSQTVVGEMPPEDDRPGSTPSDTRNATPSSGRPADSNSSVPSQSVTTIVATCSTALSSLQLSSSGSAHDPTRSRPKRFTEPQVHFEWCYVKTE